MGKLSIEDIHALVRELSTEELALLEETMAELHADACITVRWRRGAVTISFGSGSEAMQNMIA